MATILPPALASPLSPTPFVWAVPSVLALGAGIAILASRPGPSRLLLLLGFPFLLGLGVCMAPAHCAVDPHPLVVVALGTLSLLAYLAVALPTCGRPATWAETARHPINIGQSTEGGEQWRQWAVGGAVVVTSAALLVTALWGGDEAWSAWPSPRVARTFGVIVSLVISYALAGLVFGPATRKKRGRSMTGKRRLRRAGLLALSALAAVIAYVLLLKMR